MKSKLEIYALAVCFTTLLLFIVMFVNAAQYFTQIVNPSVSMNRHAHEIHQSNDNFWKWTVKACDIDCGNLVRPDPKALGEIRNASLIAEKEFLVKEGKFKLIRFGLFCLLSGIAFILHWQLARKCRGNKSV